MLAGGHSEEKGLLVGDGHCGIRRGTFHVWNINQKITSPGRPRRRRLHRQPIADLRLEREDHVVAIRASNLCLHIQQHAAAYRADVRFIAGIGGLRGAGGGVEVLITLR